MDDLKKFYNQDYVDKFESQDPNRILNLINLIPFNSNSTVLDMACGDGALSPLICKKVKEYYGIDFSEEFIEKAKQKSTCKNVHFISSEIVNYCDHTNERFDQIVALDFTEHIYDDTIINIFKAAKTVLKLDGQIYIHTPNGNYIIEILKNIGIMKQFPEHMAVRNANENKKLLALAGFKKIEVTYLSHYDSLLSKFHFLSHIPFIGNFFVARLFLKCQ